MAGGGVLSTAVSGLVAFQRSLDTTSHNIANVNTEGYSRQRAELATRLPQFNGNSFIGTGVDVENVARSYDKFVGNQLRSSISTFGEVDQYAKLAIQVDNILADPATGMAPAIKDFFNAVNELADDPSSIPNRQVMLSEAEILSTRFHTMNSRLVDLRSQINQETKLMVADINILASEIAELNIKIAFDTSRTGHDQQPNDLLDKRDLLINQLSELVDVSVLEMQNGSVTVAIGQGQSLVLQGTATKLTTQQAPLDPSRLEIAITTPSGNQIITDALTGGKLVGTLQFRDQILDPTQQKLGMVAAGLAMEFNAIHENGYDLNGNKGLSFFDFGPKEISVAKTLTSNGVITAQFQDVNVDPAATGNLDYSDYQLDYNGTNYTLTRLADNTSFNLQPTDANGTPLVLPAVAPFELRPISATDALPGININVTTALTSGDQFFIRPTFEAAKLINTALSDVQQIAAATNVEVDPATGQPVLDGLGNPVIINGPLPGDNRNALALAALENKQIMQGGVATIQDSYGQVVSSVGTLTHAAKVNSNAQEVLLTNVKETMQSISGVNLDEEAANLIKFQQAYQAAAQIIAVSSSLFDTLIASVRR